MPTAITAAAAATDTAKKFLAPPDNFDASPNAVIRKATRIPKLTTTSAAVLISVSTWLSAWVSFIRMKTTPIAAKTPIPNAAISLASLFMTELTVAKSTIKPTKAPTTTIISPILLSRPLRLNLLKVSIKAMIRRSDPTAPTMPSVFVSLILPAKAVKVTSRTRTVVSSNIFSVVAPNLRSANFLIAATRTYIATATPRTATVPTANLVVILESKKVVPASMSPIQPIASTALNISP